MGQPVVHFEIGCRDNAKTAKFFAELFDWQMQPMGPATMINTGSATGIQGHITSLGHGALQLHDILRSGGRRESLSGQGNVLGRQDAGPSRRDSNRHVCVVRRSRGQRDWIMESKVNASRWPNGQRGRAQNLLLHQIAEWKSSELIEIFLDLGTPGPGQSVPNRVLSAISSRRGKYLSSVFGGMPLMLKIDVGMTPHQEECGLHPERASAVRQQDLQLRKVHGYVVHVDGIAILVPRSGKN